MSIGSIGKLFSNVDNYIMKNGTDMPSASPTAKVALGLVALLPVVSLFYRIKHNQVLEQELLKGGSFERRHKWSIKLEKATQHYNRCGFIQLCALIILFPHAALALKVSALFGIAYGVYNAYQLRDKTEFPKDGKKDSYQNNNIKRMMHVF